MNVMKQAHGISLWVQPCFVFVGGGANYILLWVQPFFGWEGMPTELQFGLVGTGVVASCHAFAF